MTEGRVTSVRHKTRHLIVTRHRYDELIVRVALDYDIDKSQIVKTDDGYVFALVINHEQAKEFSTMLEFFAEGLDKDNVR